MHLDAIIPAQIPAAPVAVGPRSAARGAELRGETGAAEGRGVEVAVEAGGVGGVGGEGGVGGAAAEAVVDCGPGGGEPGSGRGLGCGGGKGGGSYVVEPKSM